jgi:UDP-3-O-[3-hydroxymyristoyl] N-acetylglucosamine deacetylase
MQYQRTIKESLAFTGIGLHSGRRVHLELSPAAPNTGITFVRKDEGGARIQAVPKNFSTTFYATSIASGGHEVQTVEHLMAALYSCGIDNAEISVDGPEIPIMDGSSSPFIFMIHEAGTKIQTREREFLRILKPVKLQEEDKGIAIYPCDSYRVTYTIDFNHPVVQRQSRSLIVSEESFVDEVAPARTFGFLKDVEMLRRNGLALGGSTENAIVIGENHILNSNLRFSDEFVRHKILDAIGDLSFFGNRIRGHVVAHKAGHSMHIALVNEVLKDPSAYELVKASELAPELAPGLQFVPGEQY